MWFQTKLWTKYTSIRVCWSEHLSRSSRVAISGTYFRKTNVKALNCVAGLQSTCPYILVYVSCPLLDWTVDSMNSWGYYLFAQLWHYQVIDNQVSPVSHYSSIIFVTIRQCNRPFFLSQYLRTTCDFNIEAVNVQ